MKSYLTAMGLMAWCLILTIFSYTNYDRINLVKYESEVYCDQEIAGTLAEAATDKTLLQAQIDELRTSLEADDKSKEQFAVALESAAKQVRESMKAEETAKPKPSRYSRTMPVNFDTGWRAKTVLPDPY